MQRITYTYRPLQCLLKRRTIVASNSYSTFISQKTPVSSRGPWVAASVVIAGVCFAYDSKTPVSMEKASSVYAGSVQDPSTQLTFPIFLHHGKEWKKLIGMGARQVSFLNINVYVLGLYMYSEDIQALNNVQGWDTFDKASFLEQETLALKLLQQPFDISIRIVPVRATNTQHLRDGFTRSLLQRFREQSKGMTEEEEKAILQGIKEFKGNFSNANVKKDTEFIFTKTKQGHLKMEFEGKDMGTVKNTWIAIQFMMGYLDPVTPASELARTNIASGFEKALTANQDTPTDTSSSQTHSTVQDK